MYNPLLMIDFYKAVHSEQYPKGMTKIYSPYTPRMSRLRFVNQVTYFGGQAFCKEYLIKAFNENFFNRPEEEVVAEYNRVLTYTLGPGTYNPEKVRALHRLGYLPIAMFAVPEGTRTYIGVPQSVFVNTHPDFAWLTNTLETAYSCYMWHIQVSAEVGYRYRQIVQEFYDKTCDEDVRLARLLGDFSMRGQHSPESAMKSSGGWLLSFLNTATVPAIMWMEDNYNCDITKDEVGYGAISTEHSVMCSNFAVDGDEITHVKRLLTEIYPNTSFSMVSDSYDYERMVTEILPQCREEIMNHNGTLLVRGDSGDPVEVVTWTVFELWKQFGGTVNSKGYKVLDPHVKAIYGDSITPDRCRAIYTILEREGFSIQNVALGVGSFSFMCLEHIGTKYEKNEFYTEGFNDPAEQYIEKKVMSYSPYTRDTFGIAIKATYGETADGSPVMIFKNPKELSWKKSQKGCCIVAPDGMSYTDEHTFEEAHGEDVENLLELVFVNGEMVVEQTLSEIRNRMYPEGF